MNYYDIRIQVIFFINISKDYLTLQSLWLIILLGGVGHQYMPNAGFMTLFASGLYKLRYILHQEYKDKPVRINDVSWLKGYVTKS